MSAGKYPFAPTRSLISHSLIFDAIMRSRSFLGIRISGSWYSSAAVLVESEVLTFSFALFWIMPRYTSSVIGIPSFAISGGISSPLRNSYTSPPTRYQDFSCAVHPLNSSMLESAVIGFSSSMDLALAAVFVVAFGFTSATGVGVAGTDVFCSGADVWMI